MHRDLPADLAHLETLAFRRKARCAPLLEEFHALKKQIVATGHAALIWNIYDWLLVPLSLWPLDFEGLAKHLLDTIERGHSLSSSGGEGQPVLRSAFDAGGGEEAAPTSKPAPPAPLCRKLRRKLCPPPRPRSSSIQQPASSIIQLLRLIDPPPGPETQSAVAAFEHDIESGRYEKMLKQAAKFDEQEQALLQNERLAAEWTELKRLFPVNEFQNSRGIIRRRMSQERNFREGGWPFDWSDPGRRFHFFFDAFCYRWKLYGMEYDRPLLLKISVNPTPHGTMIVIPRHWSLDPRRDLDWPLINRLHRSRGARRQGPKLSPGRLQKLDDAEQVKALREKARRQGLKGERLHDFICAAMNRDPRSDPSWWKRLLKTKN